ncbi:hypothetical protein [Laceyella putida]|uniref:hypothetical protein n=1 Tax=Laceyella putida TaxID=110101 RepID=UPI003635D9CA
MNFRIWLIPMYVLIFAGLLYGLHLLQEISQYERGAYYFSGNASGYIVLFAIMSVLLLLSLHWNRRARRFWLIVGVPLFLFAGFKYIQLFELGTRVDGQKIQANNKIYAWSEVRQVTVDWSGNANAKNLYLEYSLILNDGLSINVLSPEFDAKRMANIHEKVKRAHIPIVVRTPLNERAMKRIERDYSKEEAALLHQFFAD